jgi:hypothetical protein
MTPERTRKNYRISPETSACDINKAKYFIQIHREIKILADLFNQIRKKLVIFVHFKGFNISIWRQIDIR